MTPAIIHDWLVKPGGAENVLWQIKKLYPAPVYALVADGELKTKFSTRDQQVKESVLSKFPFARRLYRNYLPFFPYATEQLDLREYDLLLSSSTAAAKNILVKADQLHICYCNSPMRYAWDMYHEYVNSSRIFRGLKGVWAKRILSKIRLWDYSGAQRVDYFIANSKNVANRIYRVYGKDSVVIYPSVEVNKFSVVKQKEDFYVAASRFVPYKKMLMIIEAFNKMPERKLVVIGDGPEFKKAKKTAKSNISLLGYQTTTVLNDYLGKGKAFLFAAEEDFGILPVEAQACGTPVIAYGKGGALETVIDNKTGIFFHDQTAEAIIQAVNNFESKAHKFKVTDMRKNAERFSVDRFHKEYSAFVETAYQRFQQKFKKTGFRKRDSISEIIDYIAKQKGIRLISNAKL